MRNANGSYGEIRIPNRAATLTEIGFHDTCDRDADGNRLRDRLPRSTAMWGMYKGICDYFGVAPTWAFSFRRNRHQRFPGDDDTRFGGHGAYHVPQSRRLVE